VAAFEFVEYAHQEYGLKSTEMVTFNKSFPVLIGNENVTGNLLRNNKCAIY
jgi:hypothetical protein